jgi:ABC-type multidrug transport system ATPase subunit
LTNICDNFSNITRQLTKSWHRRGVSEEKKRRVISSEEDDDEVERLSGRHLLSFINLSKNFGSYTAVDNLTLSLGEDQIFCLLGHNGAGKTTILNLLIGIHKPSKGTIKVGKDLDVRYDMAEIRLKLGICHQHDILFDQLSAEQHLKLLCRLKMIEAGSDSSQTINKRVEEILDQVSLNKDRHTLSVNLSGGMKRRLSIAMGIVAESKILIMDEPTTGLDPLVRDQIWSLIRSLKKDRCILMTT